MFRLAKELGMSVERVMTEISTVEIRAWVEYFTYVNELEKDARSRR